MAEDRGWNQGHWRAALVKAAGSMPGQRKSHVALAETVLRLSHGKPDLGSRTYADFGKAAGMKRQTAARLMQAWAQRGFNSITSVKVGSRVKDTHVLRLPDAATPKRPKSPELSSRQRTNSEKGVRIKAEKKAAVGAGVTKAPGQTGEVTVVEPSAPAVPMAAIATEDKGSGMAHQVWDEEAFTESVLGAPSLSEAVRRHGKTFGYGEHYGASTAQHRLEELGRLGWTGNAEYRSLSRIFER